jgi:hypothetical protein
MVRGGRRPESEGANVRGLREFLRMIADEQCLAATAIPAVSETGWDGFAPPAVRPK